jgi:hypothetical protein
MLRALFGLGFVRAAEMPEQHLDIPGNTLLLVGWRARVALEPRIGS